MLQFGPPIPEAIERPPRHSGSLERLLPNRPISVPSHRIGLPRPCFPKERPAASSSRLSHRPAAQRLSMPGRQRQLFRSCRSPSLASLFQVQRRSARHLSRSIHPLRRQRPFATALRRILQARAPARRNWKRGIQVQSISRPARRAYHQSKHRPVVQLPTSSTTPLSTLQERLPADPTSATVPQPRPAGPSCFPKRLPIAGFRHSMRRCHSGENRSAPSPPRLDQARQRCSRSSHAARKLSQCRQRPQPSRMPPLSPRK